MARKPAVKSEVNRKAKIKKLVGRNPVNRLARKVTKKTTKKT